jgi:hypothetical protein
MKNYCVTITIAVALIFAVVIARQNARAQNAGGHPVNPSDGMVAGAGSATNSLSEGEAVWVTEMPAGYRDWRFISAAHEEGNLHSIGAVLGNDVAIQAFRAGTLPFPDGTIIAALHYHDVLSAENDKVFGQDQSHVPGDPSNVQFMIKDSKKYAATGGWGFGHFVNGKPLTDSKKMEACYDCHSENTERDMVFTRYAP